MWCLASPDSLHASCSPRPGRVAGPLWTSHAWHGSRHASDPSGSPRYLESLCASRTFSCLTLPRTSSGVRERYSTSSPRVLPLQLFAMNSNGTGAHLLMTFGQTNAAADWQPAPLASVRVSGRASPLRPPHSSSNRACPGSSTARQTRRLPIPRGWDCSIPGVRLSVPPMTSASPAQGRFTTGIRCTPL